MSGTINWTYSAQGYLCAHPNNQQNRPDGVPPWVQGDGPLCKPVQLQVTLTSCDVSPIFQIVDGARGSQVTPPFQVQDQAVYGTVGINGDSSDTGFHLDATAPSGNAPSVYVISSNNTDFFMQPDSGNTPLDTTFEYAGLVDSNEVDFAMMAGTNDDLAQQLVFGLRPFLNSLGYSPANGQDEFDDIQVSWGGPPVVANFLRDGDSHPGLGGSTIQFQNALSPNGSLQLTVSFDSGFNANCELDYLDPNDNQLHRITTLSASKLSTVIVFSTDSSNNLSCTST